MDEFLRYQRTLIVITLTVAVVSAALLFAIFPQNFAYGVGMLWGVIGGIIGFRWKVAAVLRFAENPKKPPVKGGFQQIALMFFFLAVAAVVNRYVGLPNFGHDAVNLWMVIISLVLPNIILMADGLIRPAAMSKIFPSAEDGGEKSVSTTLEKANESAEEKLKIKN